MGFGSYDESEQENRQQSTEEEDVEAVDVHEHEHDGEVSYENGAETSELLSRLGDIKEAAADEEADDAD